MVIEKSKAKSAKRTTRRKAADAKPLGQIIAEIGQKIPLEERAKFPKDGAANHDHYIYGSPKQY